MFTVRVTAYLRKKRWERERREFPFIAVQRDGQDDDVSRGWQRRGEFRLYCSK